MTSSMTERRQKKSVDVIVEHTELHLISKLRKDANLRDLYPDPQKPGPGHPTWDDGKMDCHSPDLARFETCYDDETITIFPAVVNSPSLKRNLRMAYVRDNVKDGDVILFSTDVNRDGLLIYQFYKARFQIELLFRDGKQHTGLTHCQARSESTLAFHFNTSLTSVLLAKADFYAENADRDIPFSMQNIQISASNRLFLDHIFSTLSLDPKSQEIAMCYQELVDFGTRAA